MVARLWNGADVCWTGQPRARDGVRVEPGDRAVVVDAGRHEVDSFGMLAAWGAPRPGRRVVIRLADGNQIAVSARQLELVAPDHPLRPEPDGHHGDWWLRQLEDWDSGLVVACFVPRSLPAVCRVLHPWEEGSGQPSESGSGRLVRWDEVVNVAGVGDRGELARRIGDVQLGRQDPPAAVGFGEPLEGEFDINTARMLVDVLSGATTTPDDVFVAIWQGWGDIPPERFPGAARLDTPARGHFLLRGPLQGVLTDVSPREDPRRPVSGIWWPADRAWLVHTEIDFEWTFIAGPEQLIAQLSTHPGFEVLATAHDAPANKLESTSKS